MYGTEWSRDWYAFRHKCDQQIDGYNLIPDKRAHFTGVILVLVAVALTTRFGGVFSFPPTGISTFWPANAVLLSGLIVLHRTQRVLCLVLALPVIFAAERWIGFDTTGAVIFTVANGIEVGLCLYLLKRFCPPLDFFSDIRSTTILLVAALVSSPVGGMIGAWGASLSGAPFFDVFVRWSVADFVGYCVFMPLILTLREIPKWFRSVDILIKLETFFALILLIFLARIFYGERGYWVELLTGAQFLPIPIMLWLSLRVGPWAASWAIAGVALIAFGYAIQGFGPFTDLSPFESIVSLQFFVLSIVLSNLAVAVVTRERNDARIQSEIAAEQTRLANQTSAMKSEFLAMMSHDFRTPLNAILGYSEMIHTEQLGPDANAAYRRYAGDIHTSGRRMLGMVNDLLDLSAIEAGKRIFEFQIVDVDDVVSQTLEEVRTLSDEGGVALSAVVAPEAARVWADERALYQIVSNLLTNAVKFTKSGGKVTLRTWSAGDRVEIVVTDTGVGISEHMISQISKPFVTSSENPHVTRPGSGLGLAIVTRLIEAHNGRFGITSTLGKGTRVSVTLPTKPLAHSE